jgi:hypothetical protein
MADQTTEIAVIPSVVSNKKESMTLMEKIQVGKEVQKMVLGSKKNGEPVSLLDGLKDLYEIDDSDKKKKKKKKKKSNNGLYGMDISLYAGKKKKKKGKKKHKKNLMKYYGF